MTRTEVAHSSLPTSSPPPRPRPVIVPAVAPHQAAKFAASSSSKGDLPEVASSISAPSGVQGETARISVQKLQAGFGQHEVLKSISLDIRDRAVTAIMGPSGCGKSTFVRCINRLHEETPLAWRKGVVRVDGEDIYAGGVDPVVLRRRIGMVFQRPNPFPTLSIYGNVAVGLKLGGVRRRDILDETVEKSLRRAALWEEVKDRLDKPGTSLSGGQQQRLCIARALAVDPEILLLDEPCSALDPAATARIEELLTDLKNDFTLVMVTHNIQQAARVADRTVFLLQGELVEEGVTPEMFTNPRDQRTESFIRGRFG